MYVGNKKKKIIESGYFNFCIICGFRFIWVCFFVGNFLSNF